MAVEVENISLYLVLVTIVGFLRLPKKVLFLFIFR